MLFIHIMASQTAGYGSGQGPVEGFSNAKEMSHPVLINLSPRRGCLAPRTIVIPVFPPLNCQHSALYQTQRMLLIVKWLQAIPLAHWK